MRNLQEQSTISNQNSARRFKRNAEHHKSPQTKQQLIMFEKGRNSEMLNAASLNKFWRGAANLRVDKEQSFQ